MKNFLSLRRQLYLEEIAQIETVDVRSALIETFSIRQTANRKPQFAVTRLQFRVDEIPNFSKAFSSFQFISI